MNPIHVDRLRRLERMIGLSIAETGQACVPMGAIYATCEKHPVKRFKEAFAQDRINGMALVNGWDVHQFEGQPCVWFTKASDQIPQRQVDYRASMTDSQCSQCDLFFHPKPPALQWVLLTSMGLGKGQGPEMVKKCLRM